MKNNEILQPASAEAPNSRQKWFLRYTTAILIDLVVLNLYVEYSPHIIIDSYTISIFAAIMLQALLQGTLVVERKVAGYFKAKSGAVAKVLRWFSAWLVLFGSKFVILWAIDIVFGDHVEFTGPYHGIVLIIAVLFTMIIVEEFFVRVYRKLA